MPDGRITYKSMIGKDAAGKPKYFQVYQRKGEIASELKERFERELERFTSAAAILQESPAMYEIVKKGADTSVNEFFCRYLEDFKKPAVKPSTYAYYQNIVPSQKK